jgi:hypothetical protein
MTEPALLAMKAASAGLTTLIGDRFSPGFAPQGTARPAITYLLVDDVPESAMNADTGVSRARWRLNIWATTYASAIAVRASLKAAYKRVRGTFGGIEIQDSYFTLLGSEPDEGTQSTSGTVGHVLHADVVLAYRES